MTALAFIGTWLAAYRICRLIISDSILDSPREGFYRRFPPDAEHAKLRKYKTPQHTYWRPELAPWRKISKWGQLVSCYWCIGFWVSGATVLVVSHLTTVNLPVLWWLATSTAVGLTHRNLDADA